MDERLKRIKELSKKVTNKSLNNDEIKSIVIKKYPEIKDYNYKTNQMNIQKGHQIICISINLEKKLIGIITSIKYFDHKEGEQRIIKSIGISDINSKTGRNINVLHYYLFTKQFFGRLDDTKQGKFILDEFAKKNYNINELFENYSDSDDITSQDKYVVDFFDEELKKHKS